MNPLEAQHALEVLARRLAVSHTQTDARLFLVGHALQGILAGCGTHWRDGGACPALQPETVASLAVAYADATLARLAPPVPSPGPPQDPQNESEGGEV